MSLLRRLADRRLRADRRIPTWTRNPRAERDGSIESFYRRLRAREFAVAGITTKESRNEQAR